MKVHVEPFGCLSDGTPVSMFTLTGNRGFRIRLTDYGCRILAIEVPDRNGRPADVVLGFDTLAEYLARNYYFGATVGRFAGLIACGRFTLDGVLYTLSCNECANHLHGGWRGFDQAVWQADEIDDGVRMTLISPDGDEGYPGDLTVVVSITIAGDDSVRLDYRTTTTSPTIVNLTHHSYFNLAGHGQGTILDHELTIYAATYNPIDQAMLPVAPLVAPVDGTPLDFRQPWRIGQRIDADHEQIRCGQGYDHNWVIDGPAGSLRPAARLCDPSSGRCMEVLTTEPGLQFYAGNLLPASGVRGKGGRIYSRRSGLCLEAQHFPDSPNQPSFPSTVLLPGKTAVQTTIYRFGIY